MVEVLPIRKAEEDCGEPEKKGKNDAMARRQGQLFAAQKRRNPSKDASPDHQTDGHMNEDGMDRVGKAVIIQELVKGVYRRFNHFRFSYNYAV